ncbi:ABC transporter permease [Alicyclobacillus fodiniaquatilis]|uniref:ABC transporter permease n=1 Tax=Alicyclobacillus fodiniaquatilis TaxID=1661150 RepID=A0ABW4JKK0_9BACL
MSLVIGSGKSTRVEKSVMTSWIRLIWTTFKRKPTRLIGLGIVFFFFLMAALGPLLYSNHLAVNPMNIYAAPSWRHPLGTDFEGEDVLAQIILGSRYVLLSAIIAAFFTVLFGSVLGLASGYIGGKTDWIIMRITDLFLTVPTFPLLIVLSTVVSFSSPVGIGLVMGATSWGGIARAVRSQTLSLRERGYIEAVRALGFSTPHIIFREILPNVAPYIAMNLLLSITGSIYGEVGLFFLGIIPFSTQNWGVMLNIAFSSAGAIYEASSFLYLFSPLICIMLLTFGIVFVLDAIDELLNPRLRKV